MVRPLLPLLLSLPLSALMACPRSTAPQTAATSAGPLLEVGTVTLLSRDRDGRCHFDGDRSYVVSVHRSLDDTSLVDELARRLPAIGLDDDVVLDWFGDDAPERIELVLGRDLDTGLAALLVELTATHASVPVAVSSLEDDGETCSRSKAYVGSLVASEVTPQSDAELEALAKVKGADFWDAVPASGR